MAARNPISHAPGVVSQALHSLVSQIPPTLEAPAANSGERVKSLAKTAALKAAAVSGSFTLPPGPLGMATVLPDLLAIWRIQQQLVADIAGAFGKTSTLTSEAMVICLFKHGGTALTKHLFSKKGNDVVVQRIANRTLLQLLEKIAIRVTQRIAAKSVSRWVPVLGALGAGAYAYYDTTHVASTAIELFSSEITLGPDIEDTKSPQESSRLAARSRATTKRTRRRNVRRASPARQPRGRRRSRRG